MSCILEEEKTSGQALLTFVFFLFGEKKLLFGELFRHRTEKEVKLIRKHFVDVYRKSVFAYRFKRLLTFPNLCGGSLKREAAGSTRSAVRDRRDRGGQHSSVGQYRRLSPGLMYMSSMLDSAVSIKDSVLFLS